MSPEQIKSAVDRAMKGKTELKGMPTETWIKQVANIASTKNERYIDQEFINSAINDAVEKGRATVGSATHKFETLPMEEKGKRLVELNDQFMAATISARIVSTFSMEWSDHTIDWRQDYSRKYLKYLSRAIEVLCNIRALDLGYSQEHVQQYANDLLRGKTWLSLPFPENSDPEPERLKKLIKLKTNMLNRIIASLPKKSKHTLAESVLGDFFSGKKYQ